jgi:large repetitive protein
VTEGPIAQLDFAVSLAGDPHSPVTVNYQTVDGTAVAPARYTATSGSLTFEPGGPVVQHLLVPVANDTIYDETRRATPKRCSSTRSK